MKQINKLVDYKWFLENENAIRSALTASIYEALGNLGEDARCISWFCSKFEENIAKKISKNI